MLIYDKYNQLGKNNITATSSDLTQSLGHDGIHDIIKKVLLGGNVRDVTEFITQRRLLNSYASTLDLFINTLYPTLSSIENYSNTVTKDFLNAKKNAKTLDLWLLGLTKKGLDNIVRTPENIQEYQSSFTSSLNDTILDLSETFGELNGTLQLGDTSINLNWNVLSVLFMTLGSQTLSIRGSAKSMNGKLFEKLVLGTLLSIMGFTYCPVPPTTPDPTKKLFWLSNMDENERETDATIIFNEIAVSIDIGFIGKGNPEITLDKVSRFGAYKNIGGINHNMSTIIIVDTVADNSDLFNKAARVNGKVLQMRFENWVIDFSNIVCEIFNITHDLQKITPSKLEEYLDTYLSDIDVDTFIK